MEEFSKALARRLTFSQAQVIRARNAAGETQTALGREYGVSQSAISAIIRGKNHSVSRVETTSELPRNRRRRWHLMKSFGLTLEDWDQMVVEANGACEICQLKQEDTAPHPRSGLPFLVLDHDHVTGRARGVLCTDCNLNLGKVGDSIERLEAMIAYLKKTAV